MHIHIHIHYEGLSSLERKVDHIMATQAQLAQDLNDLKASMDAVSTEIDKVSTETSTLLTKIADLETQIGNAGNTAPEVDAALQAVKDTASSIATKLKAVDDLVPDTTP